MRGSNSLNPCQRLVSKDGIGLLFCHWIATLALCHQTTHHCTLSELTNLTQGSPQITKKSENNYWISTWTIDRLLVYTNIQNQCQSLTLQCFTFTISFPSYPWHTIHCQENSYLTYNGKLRTILNSILARWIRFMTRSIWRGNHCQE